jgi:hypothetical protein
MEELVFERLTRELPPLLSMSGLFLMAKFLFLHLTLAWVVYRDCGESRTMRAGRASCAMGIHGAGEPDLGSPVYWLLHHSVLQRERRATAEEASAAPGLKLQGRSPVADRERRRTRCGRADARAVERFRRVAFQFAATGSLG